MPFFADQYGSIIEILLNHSLVYGIMFLTTALTVWTGTAYCRDNWKIIRNFYESQIKHPNRTPIDPHRKVSRSYVFLLPDFFQVIRLSLPAPSAARPHLLFMLFRFRTPASFMHDSRPDICSRSCRFESYGKKYGHDPSVVTIDEVAGMWISLLFLPKSIAVALTAFLVFRIFDIIKPYPAAGSTKCTAASEL